MTQQQVRTADMCCVGNSRLFVQADMSACASAARSCACARARVCVCGARDKVYRRQLFTTHHISLEPRGSAAMVSDMSELRLMSWTSTTRYL